ncbi:transposase [Bradyrhizobium yuanmingense]|uniref:transposase n=1 Tax=Bradyrhizobium yuanmingense TaxID=108015 RepID=UPI001FCBB2A7|nr:transposase [Bradyrhizobium yuanmingense]
MACDWPYRYAPRLPERCAFGSESLKRDPHAGDLYVFRGRRGDLIKIIWHDVQGACLFTKRRRARPCSTGSCGAVRFWLLRETATMPGGDGELGIDRGLAADAPLDARVGIVCFEPSLVCFEQRQTLPSDGPTCHMLLSIPNALIVARKRPRVLCPVSDSGTAGSETGQCLPRANCFKCCQPLKRRGRRWHGGCY